MDDVTHGSGEYIWGSYETINQRPPWKQNCNIYRGAFNNGNRHGYGTFFYANGSQYSGPWEDNKKYGEGVFIHSDGRIFYGLFKNDYIEKVNELLPYNVENGFVNPRETSEVNSQYRLNIDDILLQYSFHHTTLLNETPSSEGNDSNSIPETASDGSTAAAIEPRPGTADSSPRSKLLAYFTKETKEIERILLRYTSYLKQHYKMISERSNKYRVKYNNHVFYYNYYDEQYIQSNNLSKIDEIMYSSRQFHSCRLYCGTMDSVCMLFEQLGLIDNRIFNHYDFKAMIYEMKDSFMDVIRLRRFTFEKEMKELGLYQGIGGEDDAKGEYFENIPDLASPLYGSTGIDRIAFNDPRYPILEREFVELLTRCIALRKMYCYAVNDGDTLVQSRMGYVHLSKVIYKNLAEKVSISSISCYGYLWIDS